MSACSSGSAIPETARSSAAEAAGKGGASVRHVVLLSIDGFHQLDLDRWVASHPASTLASLVARGTSYTHVTSSRPSDSFPGTLAMTTGGSPASTGIFYDVSWDDDLSPAGSACATRGTQVPFDGAGIDVDDNSVTTSIDPARLPPAPRRSTTPSTVSRRAFLPRRPPTRSPTGFRASTTRTTRKNDPPR